MTEKLLKIDKRKTPEHREHLKAIGRKKGDPKTPGSGVKKIPEEVKEAMAARTLEAVDVLVNVMRNGTKDADRVKAASIILNPFIERTTNVNVNHAVSIADMLSEINQMRLSNDRKTIDITPQEEPALDLLVEPVVIERD